MTHKPKKCSQRSGGWDTGRERWKAGSGVAAARRVPFNQQRAAAEWDKMLSGSGESGGWIYGTLCSHYKQVLRDFKLTEVIHHAALKEPRPFSLHTGWKRAQNNSLASNATSATTSYEAEKSFSHCSRRNSLNLFPLFLSVINILYYFCRSGDVSTHTGEILSQTTKSNNSKQVWCKGAVWGRNPTCSRGCVRSE